MDVSNERHLVNLPTPGRSLLDPDVFDRAMALAEKMAQANGLPGFFRSSPGTCLAAIEEGLRLGISPFVVARNMYQVRGGQPGYYGKFIIAILNAHPDIEGTLSFEWHGPWEKLVGKTRLVESKKVKDEHDNPAKYRVAAWSEDDEKGCKVVCSAILAKTGEVKVKEVELQNCQPRNSVLWATDPRQQICYGAARRWADLYAPHILMGMALAEEQSALIDVTPDAALAKPRQHRIAGSRLDQLVTEHQDQHAEPETAPEPAPPPPPPEQSAQPAPLSADEPEGGTHDMRMVVLTIPGPEPREQAQTTARQGKRRLLYLSRGRTGRLGVRWCEAALQLNPWIKSGSRAHVALTALIQELKRSLPLEAQRDR